MATDIEYRALPHFVVGEQPCFRFLLDKVQTHLVVFISSFTFLFRKELERYFNVLEGKPLLASVRFCDVFSKSDFNLKLREVESKYQKEYDKKVEGNKI